MKLLNFGSLNIDHVYRLSHLVREGETLSSSAYAKNAGGKGLNQAIALARASQEVYFAGAVGKDGVFLKDLLFSCGVNTDDLEVLDGPTGHAIIQVDDAGRNSIILYGGTNQQITSDRVESTLSHFSAGDTLLMQNELNCTCELITAASRRGMRIVLNPSPISRRLMDADLSLVDWFILNEVEGADLTGRTDPDGILDALLARYPDCRVVLTLGALGSVYADASRRVRQRAIPVEAVDSTAAGDTFTGYFLHGMLSGQTVESALEEAAQASAITVSRPGAGSSIPYREEVLAALRHGRTGQ